MSIASSKDKLSFRLGGLYSGSDLPVRFHSRSSIPNIYYLPLRLRYNQSMIIDSHLHLSIMEKDETFELAFEKLLKNLRDNNVEKAIIIPDDLPNIGCANWEVLQKFDKVPGISFMFSPYIFKYTQTYADAVDKIFAKKDAVGIKIFPGHDRFYPTDKRCETFYQICLKYDVPIVIHTGINTNDSDCAKYNNPKHIIKITEKYPNLKIVISHYFWPKMEYCYQTTKNYGNIYFDTSAMADDEVVVASGGINKVANILEMTIRDKPNGVIFGTDYPMCDIAKHIGLINRLKISDSAKADVFYQNAQRLFRI